MICDVDHILINLMEQRNKQMRNKHRAQSSMHWDVHMFSFCPSFKSLLWLMVFDFIMCYSTNYLSVHSYTYMCVLFRNVILYGK